ncbi:MAG: cardiolipin synthase [Candidatus Cryptobacteroides sp.]
MNFWEIFFAVVNILIICGTILVILNSNSSSEKKVAWISIIAVLPIVGIVLYVIFGLEMRSPKHYVLKHKKFIESFNSSADETVKDRVFNRDAEERLNPRYRELSRMLSKSSGTPVYPGNDVEIITSGQRKLNALLEDLENAKHHIHMEYFHFRNDDGSKRIKQMLMKKAQEGVKVRFIHENIANIDIAPGYFNEMKKAGVEVVKFTDLKMSLLKISTVLNYRNHRKIVVIDGKVGYMGGMNIGDNYFLRWRDTHLRITGPAVAGLQFSFLNTFITSGGKTDEDFSKLFPDNSHDSPRNKLVQVVPDEPDLPWPILNMGATWVISNALDYVYIQTPYFVPPVALLQSLKSAALSGKDIRIMLPHKPDSVYMGPANKAFYRECLESGIRIYEKTDTFIHSKTMVSDDSLAVIGSANFDYRSLDLSYEINSYIYDRDTAIECRKIFLKDIESCKEVTLAEWIKRPWYKKIFEPILQLFSPLL